MAGICTETKPDCAVALILAVNLRIHFYIILLTPLADSRTNTWKK